MLTAFFFEATSAHHLCSITFCMTSTMSFSTMAQKCCCTTIIMVHTVSFSTMSVRSCNRIAFCMIKWISYIITKFLCTTNYLVAGVLCEVSNLTSYISHIMHKISPVMACTAASHFWHSLYFITIGTMSAMSFTAMPIRYCNCITFCVTCTTTSTSLNHIRRLLSSDRISTYHVALCMTATTTSFVMRSITCHIA